MSGTLRGKLEVEFQIPEPLGIILKLQVWEQNNTDNIFLRFFFLRNNIEHCQQIEKGLTIKLDNPEKN